MRERMSQKQKNINKNRAKKMLWFINKTKNVNEKVIMSDKAYDCLIETSEKGYSENFISENAIVDITEYSPQLKEIKTATIKNYNSNGNKKDTSTNSENSSESSSENNSESSSENSSDKSTKKSSGNFSRETPYESLKRRTEQEMEKMCSKKIRPAVYSNLNRLNQFNTLEVTLTTSEEYQTTDIKAFGKMIDDYFEKDLREELKKYIIKHRKDKKTYTYENFSWTGVISCNEEGYLHFHGLMMFEGAVSKIAPIKRKKGKNKKKRGIGFNLRNNPIQKCWKCGNAHIIHFLNKKSLPVKRIENIAEYFCKNHIYIREIRCMTDEELRERAKNEKAYKNLCALREQQSDGKRNKLFFEQRTVKKEDLTINGATYGEIKKYINGMTLINQDIKLRMIKINGEYRLQISITELYDDDYRNYKTSLNLLSKEYYREKQKLRRQPVLVQQPIQQLQQPQQLITPQEQPADCYDDEYDNYNDYDGYFESVALSEEEEVYLPYATEEDILIYEEMGVCVVSSQYQN